MTVVLYCTPADVRENVGGTDAGHGTCYQLADDQLTAAIAAASSKVSAYAGTTFEDDGNGAVAVPQLIFTVTVQLATYYATLIYRKTKDLSQYDPVTLGYQDAMQTLKDIATGAISVSPSTPDLPAADGGKVRNTLPRIFTHEDSGTVRTLRGGIEAEGAAGSRFGFWP